MTPTHTAASGLLLMTSLFSAPPATAWAEAARGVSEPSGVTQQSSRDTTLALGTVEVRARRPYADLIPAQVLSGQRLQGLNSHSVADAMRYFSGIQVKDYGGIGGVKTVDMRSMGTNHLGVFYDGLQLGNAQNGQIDLGKYSLDNVESLNLYNGQRSEIFQSARDFGMAGVVYIESRRPRFADGERPWKLSATVRTGSFGLVNPSLRLENSLFGGSVTTMLSGELTEAHGRYRFRYRRVTPSGATAWDTTATRRNGDVHSLRLEAGIYGKMPRGGYWQLKGYFYNSRRGIPGAIVNNVWKNAQRQWDRDFFVQGRLRHIFSRLYALQVNAKYAADRMRYLNPDTTLMHVDNTFRQRETYVSVANRFTPLPGLTANVAADYQHNWLEAQGMPLFAHPRRNTFMGAAAAAWRHGCLKAQTSLLGTFVTDRYTNGPRQEKARFSRLTPALFLSYAPLRNGDLWARAFFKQSVRMPTFNDLYYTDIGNVRLKPEKATQWNVGATYHHDFPSPTLFNSVELAVDAYYNRVADKIIAVPKGNGQYRWMMMNIGLAKIRGIDTKATVRAEPLPGLLADLLLNYTFQKAQDYSDPSDDRDEAGTYRAQIAYVPTHSGSAALHASWHGFEADYSFIYIGARWRSSSNIPVNREQPWYTHDLSVSYLWHPQAHPSTGLRLTLEVNNLLNQQYEVVRNYPMPGRNFKIILRCDI